MRVPDSLEFLVPDRGIKLVCGMCVVVSWGFSLSDTATARAHGSSWTRYSLGVNGWALPCVGWSLTKATCFEKDAFGYEF